MERRTFVYRNRKASYLEAGSGPALIILHGWGSSAQVMQVAGNYFSSRFRCIIPDLPGFGESEEPEHPWTIDDYAGFVLALAAETGVTKPQFFCHSFGGRIVLKLLARPGAGEEFGKVLITGGAGMKPLRKPSFYVKKYTAKFLKAPFEILPGPLKTRGLAWVRTTSLWKMLGSSDYAKLSGTMRETFVKSVNEYLEACLPLIKNEVFLLWGRKDDATPVYQAQRIEKGIKGSALVVIEDAGHYAFLDQPQQFFTIANAFF